MEIADLTLSRRSCTTGYVWGVEAQEACPGATIAQGSKRAAHRADQLGTAFHEVLVEANSRPSGWSFPRRQLQNSPPVMCPSSLRPGVTPKPTPRASICRED